MNTEAYHKQWCTMLCTPDKPERKKPRTNTLAYLYNDEKKVYISNTKDFASNLFPVKMSRIFSPKNKVK
jgi:hypothetical protein